MLSRAFQRSGLSASSMRPYGVFMATKKDLVKTSEVLLRLLEKRGMSIRELSRQTGIPQRTLNQWAQPSSNPSDVIAIKKLADFLGVSVDYLLFGTTPQPTKLSDLEADVLLSGIFRIKLERIKLEEE